MAKPRVATSKAKIDFIESSFILTCGVRSTTKPAAMLAADSIAFFSYPSHDNAQALSLLTE
jgi:hypothetical protein